MTLAWSCFARIISFNVWAYCRFQFIAVVYTAGTEGYVIPNVDRYFNSVKEDQYNLQETEFNLMNDSQKLADMQKAYLAGSVDYSYLERAQRELAKTKNEWFKKALRYLDSSIQFEYNGSLDKNMSYL